MPSTVNNVVLPNIAKDAGADDIWSHYFALTRAMKKAGWKVLASSDGTTKVVSDDPELDQFGNGTLTGVSGSGDATISAPVNGRALVTVTGSPFVAEDKGHFIHFTTGTAANQHHHQIEEFVDDNNVRIDARRSAFTPGAEASLDWEIFDTTEGGVPTDPIGSSTIAWTLMQGPSVIKIPITSAPVAGSVFLEDNDQIFFQGEEVTQTTTGATGEFMGFVFDGAGAGYLCIHPHARGSGPDPFGWETARVITGAASGTTVTQVGTAVQYVQQIVIAKAANRDNGLITVQCIDPVGETASDFATLAATATCDELIQPGRTSAGENGYPVDPLCACLLGATGGFAEVPDAWKGVTSADTMGNGQIVAIDAIPEPGYTADGGWVCFSSDLTVAVGLIGHGMFRTLDGEPGAMLCPYIWCLSSALASQGVGNTLARRQRASNNMDGNMFSTTFQQVSLASTTLGMWVTFRARGSGLATDQFTTIEALALRSAITTSVWREDPGTNWLVGSSPKIPTPKITGPIWFGQHVIQASRTWGGRLKRLRVVIDGGLLDTHDQGTKLQLSSDPGAYIYTVWDPSIVAVSS